MDGADSANPEDKGVPKGKEEKEEEGEKEEEAGYDFEFHL